MNHIKKILLGTIVAGSFVVYALHGRSEANNAVIAPRASTTITNQPQTPSGAGTDTSTTPATTTNSSRYKDGTYTGDVSDAFYGYIQVQAVIQGGKITDVVFLQAPSDRSTSREINSQADPMLKQEAIQAQTAHVDGVSGATDSSQAFVQSLGSALQKAQA